MTTPSPFQSSSSPAGGQDESQVAALFARTLRALAETQRQEEARKQASTDTLIGQKRPLNSLGSLRRGPEAKGSSLRSAVTPAHAERAAQAGRAAQAEQAALAQRTAQAEREDRAERMAQAERAALAERTAQAARAAYAEQKAAREKAEVARRSSFVERPTLVLKPPAAEQLAPKHRALSVRDAQAVHGLSRPRSQPLLSRAWNWLKEKNSLSSKQLRVSETVSLGDKRFVAVVHVEDQSFLIGGGTSGVSFLAELDKHRTVHDAAREQEPERQTENAVVEKDSAAVHPLVAYAGGRSR